MSSTTGTETGKAIPPPVLGGREAARLKWTAESTTGTVEGQTRGDVRRLQALHSAAFVVREMGLGWLRSSGHIMRDGLDGAGGLSLVM